MVILCRTALHTSVLEVFPDTFPSVDAIAWMSMGPLEVERELTQLANTFRQPAPTAERRIKPTEFIGRFLQ